MLSTVLILALQGVSSPPLPPTPQAIEQPAPPTGPIEPADPRSFTADEVHSNFGDWTVTASDAGCTMRRGNNDEGYLAVFLGTPGALPEVTISHPSWTDLPVSRNLHLTIKTKDQPDWRAIHHADRATHKAEWPAGVVQFQSGSDALLDRMIFPHPIVITPDGQPPATFMMEDSLDALMVTSICADEAHKRALESD